MENYTDKYSRVRVNYTTGLPVNIIDNLKTASIKTGERITNLVEKALEEYFANHNLLATASETGERSSEKGA